MTPFEQATALRQRMDTVRARALACRRELERQDALLKALAPAPARSTAAPAPKRAAIWPVVLVALVSASALWPRPRAAAPAPVVLIKAMEPPEDPGVRDALALVYDFPDPRTGAPMLEVATEAPEVDRLGEKLYAISFGDYRFEVDLADASVRPMTSDSIFAARSKSF